MVTSKTSNRDHDFTLALAGVAEITTDVEDAPFEAGCDDATIVARDGRVFLDFSRAAPTYEDAVRSALQDVSAAGYTAEELSAVSPPPAS